MRANRKRPSIASLFATAVACTAIGCAAPNAEPDAARGHTGTVAALSLGEGGITYADVGRDEREAWGPSALRAADDGTFWIADTAANRLVHVGRDGHVEGALSLAGNVVGARDLLVRNDDLFVLDGSAMWPHVVRYSLAGRVLDDAVLPSSAEAMVDGFLPSPDGRVLLHAGGVAVFEWKDGVISSTLEPYALGAQRFGLEFPDVLGDDDIGHQVQIDNGRGQALLALDHFVSSVRLLRAMSNGESFWSLEEVVFDPQVLADAIIVHLDVAGHVLGRARMPVADQYMFVEHPVSVDAQGRAYLLHTAEEGAEIAPIIWRDQLDPVLDERVAQAEQARAADEDAQLPAVGDEEIGVTAEALSSDTCRTAQSMMDKGFEYVNSATWLSNKNMDRPNTKCAGRKVPRYFSTADATAKQNAGAQCSGASPGTGYECIRSVPYDWGGADTVASYRTAMNKGLQAGDIDIKNPVATDTTAAGIESCSHGTDCSGFVSRAWDLKTFYNVTRATTSTLGKYSTSISNGAKSHPGCVLGVKMPNAVNPAQRPEITTACKNSAVAIKTGDILLKSGTHVTMFRKFGSATNKNVDGIDVTGRFPFHFESTQSKSFDRVTYFHWPWSRFDSFEPRRYKKVCP
jgi:cell wall-associated NlpC family hydrolase